jgi:hypothetical protein
MEVRGQLHAPATLHLQEVPKVPTGWESWGAPELAWTLWRGGKTCPCRELNPGPSDSEYLVLDRAHVTNMILVRGLFCHTVRSQIVYSV